MKSIYYKICFVLIVFISLFSFSMIVLAIDEPNIELYGFGDDYEDDDFLTLSHTKTCYVHLINIPITEKENVHLSVADESIAEIESSTYGDNTSKAITAIIKGKKLGTTDILASITYNGNTYTSKITTTVHESNYRIELLRENSSDNNENVIKKEEKLKLLARLIYGMASDKGDVSTDGTWLSSNENIAKVDNTGTITGIGGGQATITFKYLTNEGVTIQSTFDIKVTDNSIITSEEPQNNNSQTQQGNNIPEIPSIKQEDVISSLPIENPKTGVSISFVIFLVLIAILLVINVLPNKKKLFKL